MAGAPSDAVWLVAVVTVVGHSANFQLLSVNLLEPFILPFVNASFARHFGGAPSDDGAAWLWSLVAVAHNVGALLGALCLARLLDGLGRRDSLFVLAPALCVLAALLQFGAAPTDSFELLVVGRVLTGFAMNCASSYVFIGECVPDRIRGISCMVAGLGAYIWIVVGTLFALPSLLGGAEKWQYFMLVPIVPLALYFLSARFFPRSPKYLHSLKLLDRSAESVRFYHGDDASIEEVFAEYSREEALSANHKAVVSYKSLWRNENFRRPLLLCLLTAVAFSCSGEQVGIQYSNVILNSLGVSQRGAVVVMAVLIGGKVLLGVVVSVLLIERLGRRPLLLAGVLLSCVGLFIVFVGELLTAAVVGLAGYTLVVMGDVLGVQAIPQLLIAELCPQASRGKTASAFYLTTAALTIVQVLAFPPLFVAARAYTFLPLLFVETLVLVLLWRLLPETKGRAVDDIVHDLVDSQHSATEEATPLLHEK